MGTLGPPSDTLARARARIRPAAPPYARPPRPSLSLLAVSDAALAPESVPQLLAAPRLEELLLEGVRLSGAQREVCIWGETTLRGARRGAGRGLGPVPGWVGGCCEGPSFARLSFADPVPDLLSRVSLLAWSAAARSGGRILVAATTPTNSPPRRPAARAAPPPAPQADAPISHSRLSRLRLVRCSLGRLSARCPALRELAVDSPRLTQITNSSLPSLESLDLTGCTQLQDGSLRALLTDLPSLRRAALPAGPGLSDETLRAAAGALGALEELLLQGCGAGASLAGVQVRCVCVCLFVCVCVFCVGLCVCVCTDDCMCEFVGWVGGWVGVGMCVWVRVYVCVWCVWAREGSALGALEGLLLLGCGAGASLAGVQVRRAPKSARGRGCDWCGHFVP